MLNDPIEEDEEDHDQHHNPGAKSHSLGYGKVDDFDAKPIPPEILNLRRDLAALKIMTPAQSGHGQRSPNQPEPIPHVGSNTPQPTADTTGEPAYCPKSSSSLKSACTPVEDETLRQKVVRRNMGAEPSSDNSIGRASAQSGHISNIPTEQPAEVETAQPTHAGTPAFGMAPTNDATMHSESSQGESPELKDRTKVVEPSPRQATIRDGENQKQVHESTLMARKAEPVL